MSKEYIGALPTAKNKNLKTTDLTDLARSYTRHYLEHRVSDITGTKSSSDPKIIDLIINKHKRFHKGDYNYNDANDDLQATAYLLVHECAVKYVSSDKYKNKFDFCKFASENLKFKLKNYIYKLNTKRLNGSLPDSDSIRKLYYQIPQYIKKNYESDYNISDKEFNKLSDSTGLEVDKIKKINHTLTNYTISGDKVISEDNNETFFNTIEDKESNIEDQIIKKDLVLKIKKLQKNLINKLSDRERDILINIKFLEKNNISNLSAKYNLSNERIRQIAEEKFKFIQSQIKKNLELKN